MLSIPSFNKVTVIELSGRSLELAEKAIKSDDLPLNEKNTDDLKGVFPESRNDQKLD
jgi:hypothetical protein